METKTRETKLIDLDYGTIRTYNILKQLDVWTVDDLLRLDKTRIYNTPNCGKLTGKAIEELIESVKLEIGMQELDSKLQELDDPKRDSIRTLILLFKEINRKLDIITAEKFKITIDKA